MKLSNPLSLILMAAASNDVSGSSSKGGKGSARLANGGDYDWVVGNYTKCKHDAIAIVNGEPFATRSDFDCAEDLVIERETIMVSLFKQP